MFYNLVNFNSYNNQIAHLETNITVSNSNNNLITVEYQEYVYNKWSPVLVGSGTITKNLSSTWQEGNNQGGRLDSSYLLNATYNCFFIGKLNGYRDVLFTVNNNPSLPSGYAYGAKIGEIYRTRGFNEVANYPIPPIEEQTDAGYNLVKKYMFEGIYGNVSDFLFTPSGTYPGGADFIGGVLLPDGRVFCVPHNSTTARIYNPVTDILTTPSGTYPGDAAFNGGVLLPDGRVFCVPRNSTTARIYDPVTDTLTTPSGTYPGSFAFIGGVLLPDGRVFCVPYNSTTARIYGISNLTKPLIRRFVLSSYYNKF